MKEHEGSGEASWDALWTNVNLATMNEDLESYGVIENGAIAVAGSNIAWIGKTSEIPKPSALSAKKVYDCEGKWLTPGLIDCHTHLVFGGNRAQEFEQRLNGVSYEAIAKAGGGIRSTVTATRKATTEELTGYAERRLRSLQREGVTMVEIKSGYGLDVDTELTMLRAARALEQRHPVDIKTTFLGAHTIPEDYESRRGDYVNQVCDHMLPAAVNENLVDAVDVFCESIGFTPAETAKIFSTAHKLGLPVKVHADQLSDTGGAKLAAQYNALSADHIEYASEDSVKAMAEQGTVAVLLPGAFYFLRETQLPPIEQLREHKVPMAIATDANPGSSPTQSLLLMMNMACTLFRLAPVEALAGVTRNAAKALGVAQERGTLELGKRADFALWDIEDIAELSYWIGANYCVGVVKDGVLVAV